MIDFVNYVFSLFGYFVDALVIRMPLVGGLTLGNFLIAIIIVNMLIAFLYSGWRSKTFDGSFSGVSSSKKAGAE